MLELKNISKTFNPGTVNEKKALCDINLKVEDGDFITIIGSNGAGKSTLFNAVSGAFLPDTGTITIDGEDITVMPDYNRARFIGRLFQDPKTGTAPSMTVEENLLLAAGGGHWLSISKKAEKQALRERVAALGLGLEDRMKTPVGLLSGGQRQAVSLLMATRNPAAAEKILEVTEKTVADEKLTCLMITHNMSSALQLGNRTVMMSDGKIIFDVRGEERAGLTVDDLLVKFRDAGKALDNDRMLLS